MYAPMKFVEICNGILKLTNATIAAEEEVNRKSKEFCLDYISKDRAKALLDTVTLAYRESGQYNMPWKPRKFHVKKVMNDYFEQLGVHEIPFTDWLMNISLYIATDEWSKSKRVYKIEKNIMKQFCTMGIDRSIHTDALTKLPSKCFYIDYNGTSPFGENVLGCFVIYDHKDGIYLWRTLNLIDRGYITFVHTDMMLDLRDTGSENVGIRTSNFSDEVTVMADSEPVRFKEKMFVQFLINFCTYLYAANNDVEYTERTKSIYRPRDPQKTPTNKMREVEEYGVGFRRASTISMGKRKVRYTGVNQVRDSEQKRSYSSCYRCAHWHHYWVKDPENPGKKKSIVKWIEEVYVQGNTDNDNIKVHKVTK